MICFLSKKRGKMYEFIIFYPEEFVGTRKDYAGELEIKGSYNSKSILNYHPPILHILQLLMLIRE
jgi:hypothetical protein